MAQWQRDLALRPIRRAVLTLSHALRHVGLTVMVLRRRGYILARASDAASIESLIRVRASQWIAAPLVSGLPEQTQEPQEDHHG